MNNKKITIFGDGNQRRDYVFVKDTARGVVDAFEKNLKQGEIINLATGKDISINEIAKEICIIAGKIQKNG